MWNCPQMNVIGPYWWKGMTWCLSQCWPRSMSPYLATRPQWVNRLESYFLIVAIPLKELQPIKVNDAIHFGWLMIKVNLLKLKTFGENISISMQFEIPYPKWMCHMPRSNRNVLITEQIHNAEVHGTHRAMGYIYFSVLYVSTHDDVIKWKHFPRYCPLCGEFTGPRWIPRTKASDAEL